MTALAGRLSHRLTGLMPGELDEAELAWQLTPLPHLALLERRRATLVVNRVRLFAFLFAVLTPLWCVVDFAVFPFPLWGYLAAMRLGASAAFASLLLFYRPNGDLFNAYRAMALLFAIPTVFYVGSHTLLGNFQLSGIAAAIGSGYAFLPFVLLAGLAIFPLTLLESALVAAPMLLAQALSGYLQWPAMDWPSFAGAFWLLILITAVAALAGMCQLAFMIALVRQAVRDALTGAFSRTSGEEVIALQFTNAVRSGAPLAVAFLDLDHFKSVNDGFGHEAGDRVLINMIANVTSHLRHGDMLVRWGGEEFLLIMPDSTLCQAEAAMARLREIGFGLRPDRRPVTASIGIAERSGDQCADWKALVETADARMYRAKQEGRDRIVSTTLTVGELHG